VRAAVGHNVPRKDSRAKVTGAARYIADLHVPGRLYGATVRSTIPHGRLVSHAVPALPGLVVADHRDVPGQNVVALIADDQPVLAAHEIRHVAEPVLLLAHADRDTLAAAVAATRLVCEARPATFDPLASTQAFKRIAIDKGDVDRGLAAADLVVEGEYRTGHQEQLYIETNGVIALPWLGPIDAPPAARRPGVTVYGSLQCPYYVHRALVVALGLSPGQVRVVQAETGGGFGGKEEYPSMLACHAAVLAGKAGAPVQMIYDRAEDLLATTKRHPSIVRHRTGVTRDGRLVAMDIDVVMDAGAYCTLSPVVLSRGVIHATGPYRCDHVRIRGRATMTHTPPNGAFRGFGAPQTQFAVEAHLDRVAEALALDPLVVRDQNALRPGDITATGQRLGGDTSARAVLRAAVARSGYRRKRRQWRGSGRGIGLSLVFHGSGFTGAGETMLASEAALELTARGACIRVGSTEIGQGTRTMHAQIVADALGIPFADVTVHEVDTAEVPDSGPTVASRTCMIVGGLLERCARRMRQRLGGLTPAAYYRRHGGFTVSERYTPPPGQTWNDASYTGQAYGSFSYTCNVVELAVDADTGEVRPTHVTAVAEIGKAIHPQMAMGQIEGGTVQGLGYALLEEVVMRDGRMANAQLTNYAIPTPMDTPPMTIEILERPYTHGPFGAKGVGEMPIDSPAPAVVNALRHAGYDVRVIPATPERVLAARMPDAAGSRRRPVRR